jgi:hypothetical protein
MTGFGFVLEIAKEVRLSSAVQEEGRLVQQENQGRAQALLLGEPCQEGEKPDEPPGPGAQEGMHLLLGIVDVAPEVGAGSHPFRILGKRGADVEFHFQVPVL